MNFSAFSTGVFLLFVHVAFTQSTLEWSDCGGEREIKASEKIDDDLQKNILGTWRIVELERMQWSSLTRDFTDTLNVELQPWDPTHWAIFDDHISQGQFPKFIDRKLKCHIEGDSILIDSVLDYDYKFWFCGDTLRVKCRAPKSYDTYSFVPESENISHINYLELNLVDWGYYNYLWIFDHYTASSGMKCSTDFLDTLDLRNSNAVSYSFKSDRLNYVESDSLVMFRFEGGYADQISFEHVCDSVGCTNQWLTYKKK